MKLNLFALNEENLASELVPFLDAWQKEIDASEPIFNIKGSRLEGLARDVPQHQARFAGFAQDTKAVVKWLEVLKAKAESKYTRNYNNSPRALGVREQSLYIQGERDIIDLNQLIVEVALKQQHFDEIVDAIKQMAWMIGNITKLRVAELQDVIL